MHRLKRWGRRVLIAALAAMTMVTPAFAFTTDDSCDSRFTIYSLRDEYNVIDDGDGYIGLYTEEFDDVIESFKYKGKEYQQLVFSPNGTEEVKGILRDLSGNIVHEYVINATAEVPEMEVEVYMNGERFDPYESYTIPTNGFEITLKISGCTPEELKEVEFSIDSDVVTMAKGTDKTDDGVRTVVLRLTHKKNGTSDFTLKVKGEAYDIPYTKTYDVYAYNTGAPVVEKEEEKDEDEKVYKLSVSPTTLVLDEGEKGEYTLNFSEKLDKAGWDDAGFSIKTTCKTLTIKESEFLTSATPQYKLGQQFETTGKAGDHTIVVDWVLDKKVVSSVELKVRINEKKVEIENGTQSGSSGVQLNPNYPFTQGGSNGVTSTTPGAIVGNHGNNYVVDSEGTQQTTTGGSGYTPGVSEKNEATAGSESEELVEVNSSVTHKSEELIVRLDDTTNGLPLRLDVSAQCFVGGNFLQYLKENGGSKYVEMYTQPDGLGRFAERDGHGTKYIINKDRIFAAIENKHAEFRIIDELTISNGILTGEVDVQIPAQPQFVREIREGLAAFGYEKLIEIWELRYDTSWVLPDIELQTKIMDGREAYIYSYNVATKSLDYINTAIVDQGWIRFQSLSNGYIVILEADIRYDKGSMNTVSEGEAGSDTQYPEDWVDVDGDGIPDDPALADVENLGEGEEDSEPVTPVAPTDTDDKDKDNASSKILDAALTAVKLAGCIIAVLVLLVVLIRMKKNRKGKTPNKKKPAKKNVQTWNPDEDLADEYEEDYDDIYGEETEQNGNLSIRDRFSHSLSGIKQSINRKW